MTSSWQYRPLTDLWLLARPKTHFYGAYPEGFVWRARVLLPWYPALHMCSGSYTAEPNEETLDIRADYKPTHVADARNTGLPDNHYGSVWIDPPYDSTHALEYVPDGDQYDPKKDFPKPYGLLKEAARVTMVGGRIGLLHWILPTRPKNLRQLALVGILCGNNNRIRLFSVYEKMSEE